VLGIARAFVGSDSALASNVKLLAIGSVT